MYRAYIVICFSIWRSGVRSFQHPPAVGNRVRFRLHKPKMVGDKEEQPFTIHGSVFRDTPASVRVTRFLHRLSLCFAATNDFVTRVLPLSAQRSFRDRGAFRAVSDGGVRVVAGVSAVTRPRLAARFLAVRRQRQDHRYGAHPRQVIEVVHPNPPRKSRGWTEAAAGEGARGREKPKLIVFVHGGAWGSGSTWMYRLLVDRLTHSHDPQLGSYTVASLGYRVYPDADTSAQVDDLAEAMRWISGNTGEIGFDCEPEVYLMGHSSGAHIALLYLIRRAKEDEAEAAAAAHRKSKSMEDEPAGGGVDSNGYRPVSVGDGGADGDAHEVRDGDRLLDVEGFIGLGGVYDVYQHYLYESWRGVHEISPMKAANGGVLHDLFDFSHPQMLGGKPQRPRRNDNLSFSWPTAPLPLPSRPQPTSTNQDDQEHPSSAPKPSKQDVGLQASASARGAEASPSSSSGLGGDDGAYRRALGRRLPRTLVMHGTADATVPFSQTAAVADTLRTLGVPTVLRFDQGGDHFGMVGQLMFTQGSLVERAISHFTSPQAKEDARQERDRDDDHDDHAAKDDVKPSPPPQPRRFPPPTPRL